MSPFHTPRIQGIFEPYAGSYVTARVLDGELKDRLVNVYFLMLDPGLHSDGKPATWAIDDRYLVPCDESKASGP